MSVAIAHHREPHRQTLHPRSRYALLYPHGSDAGAAYSGGSQPSWSTRPPRRKGLGNSCLSYLESWGLRHHRRSYGCTPIIVSVQVRIAFSLCNIYITYRMENISTSWGFHPLYLLLSTFPICGSDVEEISCTVFSLYIMTM